MARPLVVGREREQAADFRDWVNRLDRVSASRGTGSQLMIKGLLFELLALAARETDFEDGARPGRSRERIKGILGYVETHFGEDISVEKAASLCYYSKSHFMKYFKQYMGNSFTRYLNDYRLSRAAEYLASTEDRVTEVARRCGFDNVSYFNRQFHGKYKMTPGAYRGAAGLSRL